MTPEQTEKLIQMLNDYELINVFSLICTGIMCVILVLACVYMYKKAKKVKQIQKEYESTLNEEQLKALAKWKELNK